jgi:hypothetical protein
MWATIFVIATIVVIVVVGIVLFSRTMSKSHWLKQHGTRVIARVTDVIFVPGSSNPKMITTQWTDPRSERTYSFRSLVPTTFRVKVGETVDVLVDPDNPERYSVVSTTSTSWRLRKRSDAASPTCHPERSKGSVSMDMEMLRCARHDSGWPVTLSAANVLRVTGLCCAFLQNFRITSNGHAAIRTPS